ncbi:MAG: tetratricopeptide repeat protein, partial [Mucilaginibacter sp.]|uniref:tetratricopeptide repeat protein n=1 Tax=Mucilaginibacter sp. TaxID=1882438 RepID=UPI003567B646
MGKLFVIFFLLPFCCAAQTAENFMQSGNAKAGAKNYNAAIADFTKAIQLEPKNGRAYFYRANAYNDQKEYMMAVQDYDRAIELDPKNPFAYFYRGNANNAQQKYADAITDITKAIALAPNADMYHYRANAKAGLGDHAG